MRAAGHVGLLCCGGLQRLVSCLRHRRLWLLRALRRQRRREGVPQGFQIHRATWAGAVHEGGAGYTLLPPPLLLLLLLLPLRTLLGLRC